MGFADRTVSARDVLTDILANPGAAVSAHEVRDIEEARPERTNERAQCGWSSGVLLRERAREHEPAVAGPRQTPLGR